MKSKVKSIEVYILILLVSIEAAAALFGGYSLIKDPSGEQIKLPLSLLNGTIFGNYLIPGIILFLVLGVVPLSLIYPLYFKPRLKFFNKLNIYTRYHWAWTYTLYFSIVHIIWINLQMMILGTGSIMQGATGMFGILILIVTLLPQVKSFYRINSTKKRVELNKNEVKKIV
jgi:hypothetical protein